MCTINREGALTDFHALLLGLTNELLLIVGCSLNLAL